MNKRPLILVTNDDGITAPGIAHLVKLMKQLGEVVVVAPDSPQSGKGHAITLEIPLRIHKTDIFENVEAFECSGTPVDCVKLAKNVIFKDRTIDLCVSGINHGSNAGINIIYSGTMSAAMEASLEGIDSIGFSLCEYGYDADFNHTSPYVLKLAKHVLQNGLGGSKLLNVNIPKLTTKALNGIKVCKQGDGIWEEDFVVAQDPRGKEYYWLSGQFVNKKHDKSTDLWALENNYVSVVPSSSDLTDYEQLDTLKHLEDEV